MLRPQLPSPNPQLWGEVFTLPMIKQRKSTYLTNIISIENGDIKICKSGIYISLKFEVNRTIMSINMYTA